ncbi:major facilitator superfamily multidrug-resistance, DHA1 sub-family, partial [Crucibulum laeve]
MSTTEPINEEIPQVDDPNDQPAKRTPLPKFQLFIVLLIQFAEPITGCVIYPFINQFVRAIDTGVTGGDERKTGYYAGIIESAFFFAEAATVFQWGWLSDRYGRRPILLIAPLGLTFAMLAFGLSKTFWPLVISRSFQGIFNGNIGVSKKCYGRGNLTDPTNIGDAFSMMPLMWSIGTTLGPIIGGVLTSPATRWPDTLGKIALLREYPYFLPCLVSALLAFATFLTACIGLKETLPSAIAKSKEKRGRFHNGSGIEPSSSSILIDHGEGCDYGTGGLPGSAAEHLPVFANPDDVAKPLRPEDQAKPVPLRALLTRPILMTYLCCLLLTFTDMSYVVLNPLMWSTSVSLGGLGLSPYRIGTIMGTWGFCNAFFQINFLGRVIRWLGPRKVFTMSYASFFICIGCYPLASYFASLAGGVDIRVAAVIFVQLSFQMMIYMSYGSIHILLVEVAPNKATLGSINGIAQMLGSATRSLAPTFASSLFSISLQRHLMGGNFVYYVLLVVTLFG